LPLYNQPMRVLIMRHGEALPVGGEIPDDVSRPLSDEGRSQVRRVAESLRPRGPIQRVLSSPLRRARETAEIVAETLGISPVEPTVDLSPNTSPARVRELVQRHDPESTVVLVGHHPDVTLWVAFLSNLDSSVCPLFGTASVAELELRSPDPKAELVWFQP
jgi:phosphohistidine phosphatase